MKNWLVIFVFIFTANNAGASQPTIEPYYGISVEENCRVGRECKLYFKFWSGKNNSSKSNPYIGQELKVITDIKKYEHDYSNTDTKNLLITQNASYNVTAGKPDFYIPFTIKSDGEYSLDASYTGKRGERIIIFTEEGKLYAATEILDIYQQMPAEVRNKALTKRSKKTLAKFNSNFGKASHDPSCINCELEDYAGSPEFMKKIIGKRLEAQNRKVKNPDIIYSNYTAANDTWAENLGDALYLPITIDVTTNVNSTLVTLQEGRLYSCSMEEQSAEDKLKNITRGLKIAKQHRINAITLPGDYKYLEVKSDNSGENFELDVQIKLCREKNMVKCWENIWGK